LGLRPGSEGRRFLVADPDPIDPLVAADRVRYRVQRIPHDSPHVRDSVTGEGVNDRFSNGGHGGSLLARIEAASQTPPARGRG